MKCKLYILFYLSSFQVQMALCQDTTKHQDNIMNNKAQEVTNWGSQPKIIPGLLPSYFEKEKTNGSPYLSPNWMRGVVELSDHRKVPKMNEYMYFNYDKVNNRLILINKENKISWYPIDSILGFALSDSEKIYSFEKISIIGDKLFLEPLIKSENGYSLYKRLITKLVKARYENLGYTSEGVKYDEYVDDYEYYLIYPNKVTYKKFYLKEKPIKKVINDISSQNADYSNHNKKPIVEQDLVSLIVAINLSLIKGK